MHFSLFTMHRPENKFHLRQVGIQQNMSIWISIRTTQKSMNMVLNQRLLFREQWTDGTSDYSDLVGHAQAIQIFPNKSEAAADPRALGLALDY